MPRGQLNVNATVHMSEAGESLVEAWGRGNTLNVMFLCMHNSCRSQMADGWMRQLCEVAGVPIGVASAGIKDSQEIKRGAIAVMAEVGIDLSQATSHTLSSYSSDVFDVVVSCCACGNNLSGELETWRHRTLFFDWNLDGPEKLDPGDLSVYRRVRDETHDKCADLLHLLEAFLEARALKSKS